MSRFVTMLLYGLLFWLAQLFLFYAGLMVNYIKYYDIQIFFNEFFIDNQLWLLWVPGVLINGAIFMFLNSKIKKATFYFFAFLLSLLTWIPELGEQIGRELFSKGGLSYKFKTIKVENVTLLYSGRGFDYVLLDAKSSAVKYHSSFRAINGSSD